MTTAVSSEAGGRRFHLKARIGAGAFGEVYLAEQESGAGFRRDVALKVLHADVARNPEAATRMRDEARILGRLSHRSIVKVLDLVQLGDRWAVVMDYVPGVDLEQVVSALEAQGSFVPAPAALEVGAAMCSALHAAYSADDGRGGTLAVVHRDIKPSNVRLTADGDVKVLDFGVARVENMDSREAMTQGTGWIGTERYMAPERILLEGDTSAGDVYAAFATVVELINSKPVGRTPVLAERHTPFVEESLAALRERLTGPADVVDAVVSLCRRGLAAEPERRPSASEAWEVFDSLSRRLEGDSLVRFSRSVVPLILDTMGEPEAVDGTMLVSDGRSKLVAGALPAGTVAGGRSSTGPAESTSAVNTSLFAMLGAGAVAGLAGFVLLVSFGIGAALWMLRSESAPPPTVPAAAPGPVAAPAAPVPAAAPAPSPPVEVAPAPRVAPEPAVAPAPTAAPAPVVAPAPVAAPEPAAAPAAAPVVDPSAPRVSRALFVLENASALSVDCGGVSGSGTASLRLRDFPEGACRVEATYVGQAYQTDVRVERPREVVCTVDGGTLTCR